MPAAALRHIEVQRMEAHEKRTMLSLDVGENSDKDSLQAAFEKFPIQDSDEIHIFPIAPYNTESVYLEGHVLRPGKYSFRDGMKLTDLVSSYKELLPEPAERYAEIVRIAQPDNRPVVESFNLAAALAHPESAPKLQPLDTIRIFGRYDLEAAPEIVVIGEVRAAGRYRASGQEHLRDAMEAILRLIAPIHHKFRSQKCDLFFEALRPRRSDSLLDVGGGTGILGEFARIYRYFTEVRVVNLDPQVIEEEGLEHVKCEVADGCALPFRDRSFDWVFSNAVIEHVGGAYRQQRFAAEIRRVARKGYFVATPNRHFPVDPHTLLPFYQFLSQEWQRRVCRFSPGYLRH